MYLLIMWMCLAQNPKCAIYESINSNLVYVTRATDRHECEVRWKNMDEMVPDPPGTKATHICQPIAEPL